jgi:hypothetical protein
MVVNVAIKPRLMACELGIFPTDAVKKTMQSAVGCQSVYVV